MENNLNTAKTNICIYTHITYIRVCVYIYIYTHTRIYITVVSGVEQRFVQERWKK